MPNSEPNQKPDTLEVTRWLDPDYWRQQGIEPIVIDPSDKDAAQKIADEFSKVIENIFNADKTND